MQLPYYSRRDGSAVQKFSLLTGRAFSHIARDPSLLVLQVG